MTHRIRFVSLVLPFFVFFFGYAAQAQLNFMAGYKPAYQQPTILNQYIADFNSSLTGVVNKMPEQHWLHGLYFGVRYKFNQTAVEFNYGNVFNTRIVRVRNNFGELVRNKILTVQQTNYGIGVAQYFGIIGIGGSFDYMRMNTSFEDNSSGTSKFRLKRGGFSSHFYIAIEPKNGDFAAVSLRPYIQWMWSDINLYPIANRMSPAIHSTPNTGSYNYRYPNIGLMVVLCNGPQ